MAQPRPRPRAPAGPPRAVLLGAVSRSEKNQDPEGQLVALRALAARQGWLVVRELKIYASRWDAAEARRVLEAALEPIRAGEADLLAVWAWDRVNREGIEAAFRILRELEEHYRASFYSLQEPLLSTATDPQMRELNLAFAAYAAKWESQRKSARMIAKATTKRTTSANLGVRATWGGGRGARLASVEDVREIFRLAREEDLGPRPIARRLSLSKSQVARILNGEVAGLPDELLEELAQLHAREPPSPPTGHER